MLTKAPRGTYDILPEESRRWQYLEKVIKETAELYGYREIRTPIFEHTELFERGVGDSTDIVSKEMYTFTDKAGRSLTLRPEGTACCVRALIEHNLYNGVLPIKWYYSGPMFRYDRPQKGRYRQFHQFGVEAFGSRSPYLDAEVIMLLVDILARAGLKEYDLHLNSVGCPICRESYRQELIKYIIPHQQQLCNDCKVRYQNNPLRVLDCKNTSCQQSIEGHPTLFDYLCPDCHEHYEQVKKYLQENQISFQHDDKLVRGLDYYTNTAFEVHMPGIGAQSAIGGGGRYDGLVEACGGPALPGIGFAMGMERILSALEQGGIEETNVHNKSVFVVAMNEQLQSPAAKIVKQLRDAGISTEMDYNGRSARAQMKHADKLNASLVLLLGEDEIEGGFVTIRNMSNKEQQKVDLAQLVEFINTLLASC